jgi:phosphonate transport system ATP-binding protein
LNGSLLPSQGSVCVLGEDLGNLSPRGLRRVQSQVGTIYQQYHLVDNLRVIHNVNAGHLSQWSFFKSIFSLVWPLDVRTATRALEQVGIPEKLHERTDQLSGGQQQRVAIARVLVQNPKAILADEPISSLDPERSREIMSLLVDLNLNSGKTLVASLHAIEFALSYFQRVIGLRYGKVLFDLPADEVSQNSIQELYRIAD